MNYRCLKKNCFKDNEGYQIIPVRQQDIENIRIWRNAQMDVLRQKEIITREGQEYYYQNNVWPTFELEKPSQILFSFLLHETCIGYGGFVYLDWENSRSEISFLVDPARASDPVIYNQDFLHFLKLLFQIAVDHLHLHRLFTETFAFRASTLTVLEKCGFKREGILREHVYKNGQWVNSLMHGLLLQDLRSCT